MIDHSHEKKGSKETEAPKPLSTAFEHLLSQCSRKKAGTSILSIAFWTSAKHSSYVEERRDQGSRLSSVITLISPYPGISSNHRSAPTPYRRLDHCSKGGAGEPASSVLPLQNKRVWRLLDVSKRDFKKFPLETRRRCGRWGNDSHPHFQLIYG